MRIVSTFPIAFCLVLSACGGASDGPGERDVPAADPASDPSPADAASADAAEIPVPPASFTIMTFNVGTTDNLDHSGDPDDYSNELGDIQASFYGNNLAWRPAIAAARALFDLQKPDIVAFQELYWEGKCQADCAEIEEGDPDQFADACANQVFACQGWKADEPIVVQQVLGPDYAVACAPGHPDNCVGVRKAFATLVQCDEDLCIAGLDGMPPPNNCTSGARVATAVVQVHGGPVLTVVDVHTTAGTNKTCRKAQFEQVFEDRGDSKPAAYGEGNNIVLGDMNIDPFLMEYDASVDYWNMQVGEDKRFHYISSSDKSGPNTHPASFSKLDHVISDNLTGSCVVLGVSEGTTAPLSEGSTYFDHRPVLCTVQMPR